MLYSVQLQNTTSTYIIQLQQQKTCDCSSSPSRIVKTFCSFTGSNHRPFASHANALRIHIHWKNMFDKNWLCSSHSLLIEYNFCDYYFFFFFYYYTPLKWALLYNLKGNTQQPDFNKAFFSYLVHTPGKTLCNSRTTMELMNKSVSFSVFGLDDRIHNTQYIRRFREIWPITNHHTFHHHGFIIIIVVRFFVSSSSFIIT